MIDIKKLENLPKKLGFIKQMQAIDSKGFYKWGLTRSDNHKVKGLTPWKTVRRVLTNFYQKDVNEAFSYYCTLVPKYQQKFFWDEFESLKRWRHTSWYIDDYNKIQNDTLAIKYKGPYYIKSYDYTTKRVHKVTGHSFEVFFPIKEVGASFWAKATHFAYKGNNNLIPESQQYIATLEDFEVVIVKGWEEVFASKNDPRYQRLYQERERLNKAYRKIQARLKKEKEYSMLTTKEQELKTLSELDIIKRDRHGFDENSFRGEEYHGQKRKKK